jgi:hypothetical protein
MPIRDWFGYNARLRAHSGSACQSKRHRLQVQAWGRDPLDHTMHECIMACRLCAVCLCARARARGMCQSDSGLVYASMDLYIHLHLLYILVSKILSSTLNSSASVYSLYHPLSTLSTVGSTCHLSKYIHV